MAIEAAGAGLVHQPPKEEALREFLAAAAVRESVLPVPTITRPKAPASRSPRSKKRFRQRLQVWRVASGLIAVVNQLDTGAIGKCLPVYRSGDVVPPQGGMVLFESANSGQGELADWEQAAEIAQRQKLILAGGLNPDNVARAVEQVRPWGVDVSSGIELERGVKDIGLIRAFVAAARSAP